ncbi:MAG: DNA polymerase I [Eubacteriales bacterium]|nr:DNA polymerase I [Eubacteriales bacterium]MDD4389488.1 DNA polymerase I [Eubacteriales bacterium]
MDRDNRRIVIIDGNSLINRAYYAMQRPMLTKEGLYTQGVYGFLNMLTKIKNDYEPGYIAIAFDTKAPTMRHLEYEEYKAGRKKMPPELAMQFPLLKDILSAMNIKMIEMDGFEADDIIGTIAIKAEEEGLEPLIITGDKDELQLATDKTKVIITKKGVSEFEIYDRAAMHEKYGFSPEAFIDFKGLMGDQSDNIPGIPGVGEKTATKLLLEFGSIENMLENADSIKNEKLRNKIKENELIALMSKRLATINTKVPIGIDFDEYTLEEPDYEKLIQLYVKLEFNSFLKKLKRPDVSTQESTLKTFELTKKRTSITDSASLKYAENKMKDAEFVSIKILTDSNHRQKPEVYCFGILVGDEYFFINGAEEKLLEEAILFISENQLKICGHGLSNEYFIMLQMLGKNHSLGSRCFNTHCDTQIAAYILDSSRSNYELKTLILEYFNIELSQNDYEDEGTQIDLFGDAIAQYSEQCLVQCTAAALLSNSIEENVAKDGMIDLYKEVELPLVEIMAFMEYTGFAIDKEILLEQGKKLSESITIISNEIYELAGEKFNINSPAQLGNILFEKLGLPSGKKTKRGYSTNADILERLKDKHPIITLILEYRTLSKLNGTYVEGLLPMIGEDGRIHAHFMQTVTATGRISCTEPNLQNIPIKQEQGRLLRKAFVTGEEYSVLIGADYSQIELRVLAHMSGDEKLIEAFSHGDDIHRITAATVFDAKIEDVTPEQRSAAKAVNFGVIYGMSSFGLSGEIKVTRKQAQEYIDGYFLRYSSVKKFMDNQIDFCKNNGYVKSILERRRYIKEINASNHMVRRAGERLAMNSPIQGSAADIIKLAMIKIYNELKKEKLKSRLILQVHDELIIEATADEEFRVEQLLKECMEEAIQFKVKLTASLSKGENWYELK